MKKFLSLGLIVFVLLLAGCNSDTAMKDGFYTAQMANPYYGWKEYLCIMVKNNTIVYAEYNAKDPSGYIKSWDNSYMKNMIVVDKTYPNEYTRNYVAQLMKSQNPETVDVISGATGSGDNFLKLSTAVINQAKNGDTNVILVE